MDEGITTRRGRTQTWGRNKGQQRQMDQAHFGNFKKQSRSSIIGPHEHEPENLVIMGLKGHTCKNGWNTGKIFMEII